VAENASADFPRRAKNTLYAGRNGKELEAVIRIYLPDQGSARYGL
jgi:hypothetical protein